MRYWLNIHHPVEVGHSRDEWNQVYLKEMHRNTALHRIKKGDIAVIYEKDWEAGKAVQVDDGEIQLQQGRKGIVAIVRITSVEEDEHSFDGDRYIAHFNNDPIRTNFLVPLEDIRQVWRQHLHKEFVPHINGGLRELNAQEWQVIATLVRQGIAPLPDE